MSTFAHPTKASVPGVPYSDTNESLRLNSFGSNYPFLRVCPERQLESLPTTTTTTTPKLAFLL